jgi:hypothetical protein
MDVGDAVSVTLNGYRCGEAVDDERAIELRKVFAHLGADVAALEDEADNDEDGEDDEEKASDLQPAGSRGTKGRGGFVVELAGSARGGCLVERGR